MYDIDRYTKQKLGFKNLLMENARRAVCEKIYTQITKTDKIIVFSGTGNNGGDGYVVARTLINEGFQVTVVQVGQDEKMAEETYFHKQLFLNCVGSIIQCNEDTNVLDLVSNHDILVDVLLCISVIGCVR